MELRRQEHVAYIKLVYCGPAGAGKSTNLAWLHRAAKPELRGELLTAQLGRDRTLWFDFSPLHETVFRDFTIRFLVVTVSGKTTSGMTYKQVMRGADGVVFVADSSPDRLYETITSYRETAQSLEAHQLEAGAVPVVLQYNKRDAEHALSRAELDDGVNPRKHEVYLSVATLGDGVLETFHDVLRRTLASIAPQNESLPLLKGMEIGAYADALIAELYGRTTLTAPPPSKQQQPREDSRPIPVLAMPTASTVVHEVASEPVTRRLSLADFEAALAHSKAKATPTASPAAAAPPTATPASGASRAAVPAESHPLEKGALYEGLRAAIVAADALMAAAPLEAALHDVLSRLVEAAGAAQASVLLPGAGGAVNVAGHYPPTGDPVARSAKPARLVATLAGKDVAARVHDAASNAALAEALRGHVATRVLSAPIRSPRGLHGVLLVYLKDAPDPALAAHAASLAQALSLALRYR